LEVVFTTVPKITLLFLAGPSFLRYCVHLEDSGAPEMTIQISGHQ
jgi:hypothetical protein